MITNLKFSHFSQQNLQNILGFSQCATVDIRYDLVIYKKLKKFILTDFQIMIYDL